MHVLARVGEWLEPEFLVQPMGIVRRQGHVLEAAVIGMVHHGFDQKTAETVSDAPVS